MRIAVLACVVVWGLLPAQVARAQPVAGAAPDTGVSSAQESLAALKPFAGRLVRQVQFMAWRFGGRREPIRKFDDAYNFVRGPEWLMRYVRSLPKTAFVPKRLADDLGRLRATGLFSALRADVKPVVAGAAKRSGEDGGGSSVPAESRAVDVVFTLKSKPIAKLVVDASLGLRTEGLASLKARLPLKEGEEYTEIKRRLALKLLHTDVKHPNIGYAMIRAEVTRYPDGRADPGLTVTLYLIENGPLAGVEFEGVDDGSVSDLEKAIQADDFLVDSPDLLAGDVRRIRDYYHTDEGNRFVEVSYRYEVRPNATTQEPERWLVYVVDEGPSVAVATVEFRGLEHVIPPEGSGFFEPPSKWWDLWFGLALWVSNRSAREQPLRSTIEGTGDYRPKELDRDCRRLEGYFQAHGYLDCRAYVEDVTFTEDRTGVHVAFRIEPGALYRVRSVTIAGHFGVSDAMLADPENAEQREELLALRERFTPERLYERLRVKEGQPYRRRDVEGQPPEIEGDRPSLLRYFRDAGYSNAQVNVSAVKSSPTTVDLVYTIDQKRRVRIGRITITGNTATKESVIRERLASLPGLPYSMSRLEGDTQRLLRTQWFEQGRGVRITPRRARPPYSPDDYVDLDVQVREGQTGSFNLGMGFTTNRGLIGFIQITKRNFDIADFPSFTGAGQTLSLNLSPGLDQQSQYSLTFSEPFFFGTRFGFSASLALQSDQFTEYTQQEKKASMSWSYLLATDVRVSLTTSIGEFKATDVLATAPPEILEAQIPLLENTLGARLAYDRRNDQVLPSRGYNVETSFTFAGGFLAGTADYLRWGVRASYQIPLYQTDFGEEAALSFRWAFDWQEPHSGQTSTPLIRRLFLGGAGSPVTPAMRGFAFRGVGPRRGGESIGGDARLAGSFEFTLPLKRGILYFVAFTDAGQLVPGIDDVTINRWNLAWGFGLRVRLPISPLPLAFDFGFPLQTFAGDEQQIVSFTFGLNF